MTNCGKTYYLLEMLEKEYKHQFDYIALLCPTYIYNITYQKWRYKYDKKFIVIPCEHEDADDCLKYVVEFLKETNSLIILDDLASSKDIKGRTNEITKLGFGARHIKLSIIVITQQLTSISKPFRENIQQLIMFYNPNKNDIKTYKVVIPEL